MGDSRAGEKDCFQVTCERAPFGTEVVCKEGVGTPDFLA